MNMNATAEQWCHLLLISGIINVIFNLCTGIIQYFVKFNTQETFTIQLVQ